MRDGLNIMSGKNLTDAMCAWCILYRILSLKKIPWTFSIKYRFAQIPNALPSDMERGLQQQNVLKQLLSCLFSPLLGLLSR